MTRKKVHDCDLNDGHRFDCSIFPKEPPISPWPKHGRTKAKRQAARARALIEQSMGAEA